MEYSIVPASVDHASYLADNLSEGDLMELHHSSGKPPYDIVVQSIDASDECRVVLENEIPVIIFGTCALSVSSSKATIWMLSAELSLEVKKMMLLNSRWLVDEMMIPYSLVFNYVWVGNTTACKWLRWLGFTLHDPIPYGINGELFHYFEKVK